MGVSSIAFLSLADHGFRRIAQVHSPAVCGGSLAAAARQG
jgi:hypothetical protein